MPCWRSDAEYRRLDLELGAGLSRHELNVALHGDGARLHANGVLLATGKRHLDTRLGIDHVGRDSSCELTWRGLGAGRAKAAFHGGILIREGADGSDANLSNKNLLLSAKAPRSTPSRCWRSTPTKCRPRTAPPSASSTRPRCSTCARRGVPAEQARALLTAAFCRETLARVRRCSACARR